MSIEKLLTVPNSIEAASIQNRLENAGVESFVTNENFSTLMPHFYGMLGSGVQIMIEDTSVEKAKETLVDYFPDADTEATTNCPECGSTKIGYGFVKSRIGKILIVFISLLIANPFGNIQASRHCKKCGHEF